MGEQVTGNDDAEGYARALRDNRVPPPGAENVEVFRDARGGYFVGAAGRGWQDAYTAELAAAARPSPVALRAAR